jgi:hypothetical protein
MVLPDIPNPTARKEKTNDNFSVRFHEFKALRQASQFFV